MHSFQTTIFVIKLAQTSLFIIILLGWQQASCDQGVLRLLERKTSYHHDCFLPRFIRVVHILVPLDGFCLPLAHEMQPLHMVGCMEKLHTECVY